MFQRIDHVVVAVKNLEESTALYRDTYGLKVTEPEELPAMGLRRTKIDVGNAYIELAEPLSDQGPIAKFLENTGEGLYLIAVLVADLRKTVDQLQERGARVLGAEHAGAPDSTGKVFLHPSSAHGALIMLMQE